MSIFHNGVILKNANAIVTSDKDHLLWDSVKARMSWQMASQKCRERNILRADSCNKYPMYLLKECRYKILYA